MTKADNVSFDIESSDDKDSFVVVVVDSLAVCDHVFRVVLGTCGFDLGGFDVVGGFEGFDFVGFDIEDLAIGGGINRGLCMYFVIHKKCTIPTCPFAHSIAAVKAANPFFKTGPCKEFQNGACNYGNFADVEGGHPTNWCGRIHLSLPQML